MLIADIEGGELDLFAEVNTLDPVQVVVLEMHPGAYGIGGMDQVIANLWRLGFIPDHNGSGHVRIFRTFEERKDPMLSCLAISKADIS